MIFYFCVADIASVTAVVGAIRVRVRVTVPTHAKIFPVFAPWLMATSSHRHAGHSTTRGRLTRRPLVVVLPVFIVPPGLSKLASNYPGQSNDAILKELKKRNLGGGGGGPGDSGASASTSREDDDYPTPAELRVRLTAMSEATQRAVNLARAQQPLAAREMLRRAPLNRLRKDIAIAGAYYGSGSIKTIVSGTRNTAKDPSDFAEGARVLDALRQFDQACRAAAAADEADGAVRTQVSGTTVADTVARNGAGEMGEEVQSDLADVVAASGRELVTALKGVISLLPDVTVDEP